MDPITLTTEPSPFYILDHGSRCEYCQDVRKNYSGTEWFRWSPGAGAYISRVSYLGEIHGVRIVPMRAAPWEPESRIARKLTAPLTR